MSLLSFPPSPTNGQLYPTAPLPGQTQYRWEAVTTTWRIVRSGGGGVNRIIAGTNITLDPPAGIGDVVISSSGGVGGDWTFLNWDDISGQFDGVRTTFFLTYQGNDKVVEATNIQVFLGGVFQLPDAYTFNVNAGRCRVAFSNPPPTGLTFAAFSIVSVLP